MVATESIRVIRVFGVFLLAQGLKNAHVLCRKRARRCTRKYLRSRISEVDVQDIGVVMQHYEVLPVSPDPKP